MPPFDLDSFLAPPRVSGLALSPDRSRLVTSVATVAPDGTKFESAPWQLDPANGVAGHTDRFRRLVTHASPDML